MIIDKNFEDLIIACMYRNLRFMSVAVKYLDVKFFDDKVKKYFVNLSLNFYKKYSTIINKRAFIILLKYDIKRKVIDKDDAKIFSDYYKKIIELEIDSWEFVLDELVNWIKIIKLKKFIEKSVDDYIPKSKIKDIERGLNEIININVSKNVEPYDYWAEIDNRTLVRTEEVTGIKELGIPTGIKKLDGYFHKRGFYRGELYVIIGAPKRGKTMSALWFANNVCLQGRNVVYFSCEVSKYVLADRLDALNSELDITLLSTKIKDVENKIKSLREKAGNFIIFDYPTKTLTPNMIKNDLDDLIKSGVNIDFLVVDYADIMRPNFFTGDKLYDEGSIFEDLRGIGEEYQLPVLTLSQLNRQGTKKTLSDGTDTSGTYDKIKVADLVMTLNQTQEEKKKSELRIHISENRNGASAVFKIKTDYHKGKFFKELILEEEDD